jgi:hypothetical protein
LKNFNYVTIEEREADRKMTLLSEMKIDGKNIAFLADMTSQTSRIESSETYIQTSFFKGSELEICLVAQFFETEPAKAPYRRTFPTRGIFIEGELTEKTCETASLFLRGTGTLEAHSGRKTAKNGVLFIDSGGFAYIGKSHEQFQRIVIVAMLCAAYVRVLEKGILDLSKTVRDKPADPASIALRERVLLFNAGYYQRLPVRLETHEVSNVWDGFYESYRIDTLRSEFDAQLSAVAQWLAQKLERLAEDDRANQIEAEKQRAGREGEQERRLNKAVTIITVAIAVLSFVVAIIATPLDTLAEKRDWLVAAFHAIRQLTASTFDSLLHEIVTRWKAMR